jgi:hypothetical protein
LDALPYHVPVTGKNSGEDVKQAGQNVEGLVQNIADLLEYALENRSEHLAEAVPDSLHYFGYVLELEPQRVEPVHNSLPELVELGLDSVPDRCDLVPKFFVVFP